MQDAPTTFVEGESRTVIDEASRGSLLETYRKTEEIDLAGRVAKYYRDLTAVSETEPHMVREQRADASPLFSRS